MTATADRLIVFISSPSNPLRLTDDSNNSASRPNVVCAGWRPAGRLAGRTQRSGDFPIPGGCVHDGTTQQRNTHITDLREICYSWHPWHGRAVLVHATLVKRGRPVAYCSLEEVPTCRVLEVPLWMLDAAACCKTRISKPGFASAQSLRDLKEVLQSLQARVRDHTTPGPQHRYFLDAGGADGDIVCPAEIEPTPVVCSSAKQIALDGSVVRCSTKDHAIAGAGTEAASRKRGRDRTHKGGAE